MPVLNLVVAVLRDRLLLLSLLVERFVLTLINEDYYYYYYYTVGRATDRQLQLLKSQHAILSFFFELLRPAGWTPNPMLVKCVGLCGCWSTKVVKIWCDSVDSLRIYRQKTAMGRFWGFSSCRGDTIQGLAWNLAWRRGPQVPTPCQRRKVPQVPYAVPHFTLIREYLSVSGPKKREKLKKIPTFFRPAGANPVPYVDDIRGVYAGNRSTKAVNIWYDSVIKLGIYRQKTAMGHFPQKFSESPSSETTGRIEKFKGRQNGTDSFYFHAKFGVDPSLHGGVRNKSWVFLFLPVKQPPAWGHCWVGQVGHGPPKILAGTPQCIWPHQYLVQKCLFQ